MLARLMTANATVAVTNRPLSCGLATSLVVNGSGKSRDRHGARLQRLLPGMLLAGVLAVVAHLATPLLAACGVVVGPMVVAMLLGLLLAQFCAMPVAAQPGVDFACRPVLRFAIVLLGLRISLPQVAAVVASGLLAVTAIVLVTLLGGYWISRRLGL